MAAVKYQCPECGARIDNISGSKTDYTCLNCSKEYILLSDSENRPVGFNPRKVEPLNLPKGSVRAAITLLSAVSLILQALKGVGPSTLLLSLFISTIFYYFGFRRVDKRVSVGGTMVETNAKEPLNLPHGFIRSSLIVSFMIFLGFSYFRGNIGPEIVQISIIFISLIGGYFFAKNILSRVGDITTFNHIKAGLTLGAALGFTYIELFDPSFYSFQLALSGILSFYFGSRR